MKAELLFAKLANLLEHHCAWSALLSMGNLDTLIEHCCLSPDSYEANFKALQNLRREAEALSNYVKVDCVCISLGALKAGLEEQFQRAHDYLRTSLKRTMLDDIKQVCLLDPFL
jgi:hypothetical protein